MKSYLPDEDITAVKARKLAAIDHMFNTPYRPIGPKTGALDLMGLDSGGFGEDVPDPVVQDYSKELHYLIESNENGWVLDVGAGRPTHYFENVVTLEKFPNRTTDVSADAQMLPFENDTFDAVFSITLLEHVRHPRECANEMVRVLKPGGSLACYVPHLQPYHGYPSHYYNATHQGLRNWFRELVIHKVTANPGPQDWAAWCLRLWAESLEKGLRKEFEAVTIGEMIKSTGRERWSTEIPEDRKLLIPSGCELWATKAL